MKEILEKLNNRADENRYFIDCATGQKIHAAGEGSKNALAASIEHMDDRWLVSYIQERSVPGEVINARFPLDGNHRAYLENIALDQTYAVASHNAAEAQPDGCSEYQHCFFCPTGRRLMAKDLWEHIMGHDHLG